MKVGSFLGQFCPKARDPDRTVVVTIPNQGDRRIKSVGVRKDGTMVIRT